MSLVQQRASFFESNLNVPQIQNPRRPGTSQPLVQVSPSAVSKELAALKNSITEAKRGLNLDPAECMPKRKKRAEAEGRGEICARGIVLEPKCKARDVVADSTSCVPSSSCNGGSMNTAGYKLLSDVSAPVPAPQLSGTDAGPGHSNDNHISLQKFNQLFADMFFLPPFEFLLQYLGLYGFSHVAPVLQQLSGSSTPVSRANVSTGAYLAHPFVLVKRCAPHNPFDLERRQYHIVALCGRDTVEQVFDVVRFLHPCPSAAVLGSQTSYSSGIDESCSKLIQEYVRYQSPHLDALSHFCYLATSKADIRDKLAMLLLSMESGLCADEAPLEPVAPELLHSPAQHSLSDDSSRSTVSLASSPGTAPDLSVLQPVMLPFDQPVCPVCKQKLAAPGSAHAETGGHLETGLSHHGFMATERMFWT